MTSKELENEVERMTHHIVNLVLKYQTTMLDVHALRAYLDKTLREVAAMGPVLSELEHFDPYIDDDFEKNNVGG